MKHPSSLHTPIKLPVFLRLFRRCPLPHKLGLLERMYGNKLSKNGISWVETSNGVIWKLDLRDSCERWIVYGDYEGLIQMNWIRSWLEGGGAVIDSGANIGQMLLYLAPLPNVSIHAFEPTPDAYEWLMECLNRYPDWQVIVNNLGLSSYEGQLHVQLDGAKSTARMDWYKDKNLPKVEINVQRLDSYMSNMGIEKIRLWKLDVEGCELEALKGSKQNLLKKNIDAILVEMSKGSQIEVTSFLEECDYELYALSATGHVVRLKGEIAGTRNMIALPVKN